jgi:hypothetical protein
MPKLYVANMTKQNHDFAYRLKGQQAWKQPSIPVGQQIMFDWPRELIDEVIQSKIHTGIINVIDLPRNREFVGLCYSIDKPVQLSAWDEALERNDTVLNEAAEARLEDVATTVAGNIQTQMRERGVEVPHAEVTTVEETRDTPRIAKGFEVVAEGAAPRHPGKPGRRARQQQARQ